MSDNTPEAALILAEDPEDADRLAPDREHGGRQPDKPRTLAGDAWYDLRHSVMFWISVVLLVFVMAMVLFPNVIADADKTSSLSGGCILADSLTAPNSEFRFGTDQQGCDIYALSVFGARASVAVGVIAAVVTTLIGAFMGVVAGFYGGWLDGLISRITDIFFGLPLTVVGIAALSVINLPGIWGVVLVLSVLGWVTAARLVRGQTIEAKNQDYTLAARALGANNSRIMTRHILPNAIGPSIVVAVLTLGAFIAAEATFSFLGIGIRPPAFSWGTMISDSQTVFFEAPWTIFFPALFLSVTVLAFILLGEAVSQALDPKARK